MTGKITTTVFDNSEPTFIHVEQNPIPTEEEIAFTEFKHNVLNPIAQAARDGTDVHLDERQTALAERFMTLYSVETKLVWENETPEHLEKAAYLLKLDLDLSQGLGNLTSITGVRLLSYNKTPPLHQLAISVSVQSLMEQLPFLPDLLKTDDPSHEPQAFELKIPLTDEKYCQIIEKSTVL